MRAIPPLNNGRSDPPLALSGAAGHLPSRRDVERAFPIDRLFDRLVPDEGNIFKIIGPRNIKERGESWNIFLAIARVFEPVVESADDAAERAAMGGDEGIFLVELLIVPIIVRER